MFEKMIETMEEQIRSLETSEGKVAYEKKKEEADKRAEKAKAEHREYSIMKSYEEYLQYCKSRLAQLRRQEHFATITDMTEKSVTVKCEDGEECCIPLEEFALYSPVRGSRVAVNIAGSKAHLVLYSGELAFTDAAAVSIKIKVDGCVYFDLGEIPNPYKTIPYSYFGTSDLEFYKRTGSPIDVFCVDGEYYPAPSCIEKLRDARKQNPLASLQETLEEILDVIKQDSEE